MRLILVMEIKGANIVQVFEGTIYQLCKLLNKIDTHATDQKLLSATFEPLQSDY